MKIRTKSERVMRERGLVRKRERRKLERGDWQRGEGAPHLACALAGSNKIFCCLQANIFDRVGAYKFYHQ